MGFLKSVESGFRKYVVWKGRASRSEFWWFYLFCIIGTILTNLIGLGLGLNITIVFSLATFLPQISVLIRRLHDTGHSGWWYWIFLMPIVIYSYEGRNHKLLMPIFGFMYSIKLLSTSSGEGDNKYGSSSLS